MGHLIGKIIIMNHSFNKWQMNGTFTTIAQGLEQGNKQCLYNLDKEIIS